MLSKPLEDGYETETSINREYPVLYVYDFITGTQIQSYVCAFDIHLRRYN